MKITKILLLAALCCFGPALAQEPDQAEVPERYADLERDRSGFRETFVAPDADFTKFDKLYIWKAEFQYRDVGPAQRTRSTMISSRKSEFGISEKDRQAFQEIVHDAFFDEIKKGERFELVDTIGPDTLVLRGAVLDIVSRVPPETIGRSDIYLNSIGEATLVMELIDAETGQVLALVAERRALQRPGFAVVTPTNNATIISDIRAWSRRAAKVLRTELDNAIAGR